MAVPWPRVHHAHGVRRVVEATPSVTLHVRRLDMDRDNRSNRFWLTAVVVGHFVVALVHGAAHAGAQIPLSFAATSFVFVIILAGPLAGLFLMWLSERRGAYVIAFTMAGALIFGVLNHFVIAGADHVAHVAGPWQPLFTTTAVLLAVTESLGVGLALRLARRTSRA